MTTVYAMQLENNKFYVGSTKNIETLKRKLVITAKWTKLNKPIRICEEYEISLISKSTLTKYYMLLYGIENVRGGGYCSLNLENNTILSIQKLLDDVDIRMSIYDMQKIWNGDSFDDLNIFDNIFNADNRINISLYELGDRFQNIAVENNKSKQIKCPVCRYMYDYNKNTIKIKGIENECCVCLINNSEILCPGCCTIILCSECADNLR